MPYDGAGSDGKTAPGANTLVKADDVPVLPDFTIVMDDDDIGDLDESELQYWLNCLAKCP